jgi:hypothetical protein
MPSLSKSNLKGRSARRPVLGGVQYLEWFTAVTTDPKHKEALGETPVKLAAGAAGS